MKDGFLTQEEIDKHFRNSMNQNTDATGEVLTDAEKDVIGEAGNIFIATSATSLSMILDKRVQITTPVVTTSTLADIHRGMVIPYVVFKVKFEHGIQGTNLLLIKTEDASIIADIMMGGDGTNVKGELNEIELSAVSEAMNQMIGSASTSIATMLDRKVDIGPPEVEIWNSVEDIEKGEFSANDKFIKIAFKMTITDLLESNIMQLFSIETVKEIIDVLTMGSLSEINEAYNEVEDDSQNEDLLALEEYRKAQQNADNTPPMPKNMELLLDVLLELKVVFGRTRKSIKELLTFGNGTVIELNEYVDEPLEIHVNNKLIAYGEVVVIDEKFGIRVTSIIDAEDRFQKMI